MSTQYRMLEEGERVLEGDETNWRNYEICEWHPVCETGIGWPLHKACVGNYRRPLTPATAQQQPSDAAQLAAEATRLQHDLQVVWEGAEVLHARLEQTLARLTAALQQETK